MAEELFLEIFGDPSLDDDITAVALGGKRYISFDGIFEMTGWSVPRPIPMGGRRRSGSRASSAYGGPGE